MKIQHTLIVTVLITLVVSLICVSLFPSVQSFMRYNTLWNGLRHSLNAINASTIDSSQDISQIGTNNVLVCIPYLQYTDNDLVHLKNYVDRGGTLMIMDDFGYGNEILSYLGIDCRFSGAPLLDPLYCYKNQWFPEVTDFSPAVSKDVKEVVLNHATALQNIENSLVIAWSSSSSYLDGNGNGSFDEGELKGPLPVAAKIQVGTGTIILVSDPSILINSMLTKDDNLLFVKSLTGSDINNNVKILVDASHLVQDQMEITKIKLVSIKEFLSQPVALLGIVSLLFIFASIYILKMGGSIGRES
jgi:hypothetical protein